MMKAFVSTLLFAAFALHVLGQNAITGKWTTIDDSTGEPRGVVHIYPGGDGLYYGKLTEQLGPDAKPDDKCTECDEDDPRYNQPVIGMVIITKMRASSDLTSAEDGEILDPENGNVYGCELEVTEGGNRLKVRGFLGFSWLGRTQEWVRRE